MLEQMFAQIELASFAFIIHSINRKVRLGFCNVLTCAWEALLATPRFYVLSLQVNEFFWTKRGKMWVELRIIKLNSI